MKIAALIPFKAALVAASITTLGLVAIDQLDTVEVDYGVPDNDIDTCQQPLDPPARVMSIDMEPIHPGRARTDARLQLLRLR